MADDLIITLDRFLEAARRVSKRRSLKAVERKLERAMKKAFTAQGKAFMKEFAKHADAFPPEMDESHVLNGLVQAVAQSALREAISESVLETILRRAEIATLELFVTPIQEAAKRALSSGARAVVAELGMKISFSLKNPRAVDYLEAHGADLVKKINETTRGYVKTVVTQAVEEGWSYNRTALALQERYREFAEGKPQQHIDSRAHLIAVTEAGEAYEEGNFIVIQDLQEAGIETEKHWSTMKDRRVSQGCLDNEAEGWIPADQAHKSGHMHPLRFPGCRCDELYRRKK